MRRGEIIFLALIGLVGAGWVGAALDMPYMDDGVPAAGYFPLWIGAALVALVVLLMATSLKDGSGREPSTGSWRRPLLVAIGLAVSVALINWIGFGVAVAVYLAFLLGYVERLRWGTVASVAVAAPAAIALVFRTLLAVPLPRGPWGF